MLHIDSDFLWHNCNNIWKIWNCGLTFTKKITKRYPRLPSNKRMLYLESTCHVELIYIVQKFQKYERLEISTM
jgi:hypothetical protein